MLVDAALEGCRIVYVTPSHQAATGVTMSLERRRALLEKAARCDMLIVEDDFDCESNYKGYPHPALRGMDIVWNAETISRLFEIGPNAYTPGTKMPEQIIGDAEDRAALMRFLEQATRPR